MLFYLKWLKVIKVRFLKDKKVFRATQVKNESIIKDNILKENQNFKFLMMKNQLKHNVVDNK